MNEGAENNEEVTADAVLSKQRLIWRRKERLTLARPMGSAYAKWMERVDCKKRLFERERERENGSHEQSPLVTGE